MAAPANGRDAGKTYVRPRFGFLFRALSGEQKIQYQFP
jgi:hypothetical protein